MILNISIVHHYHYRWRFKRGKIQKFSRTRAIYEQNLELNKKLPRFLSVSKLRLSFAERKICRNGKITFSFKNLLLLAIFGIFRNFPPLPTNVISLLLQVKVNNQNILVKFQNINILKFTRSLYLFLFQI